ncbi:MAG: exosortase F system-associated protein [Bacteroidota bacterium]
MKKIVTWFFVLILVGLLVAIRAFESELFYDPLIEFFKTDHSTKALPEMDRLSLVGYISIRFWMNTLVSLGLLWLLFRKREVLKLSLLLFGLVFVVLTIAFAVLLGMETPGDTNASGGHLALFYVRRFLIQPLFLLLLIPAFYFQKKS